MKDKPNVAATLERALACRILRGEYPPGTRLPSLRAMSQEHGVTVPTLQRVIAGLDASGLVTVRHGSGVTVQDPARVGGLALIPLWFEALVDQPERCAAILGDFLELRRVFAAHLTVRARQRLTQLSDELAEAAAALFAAGDTLEEVADADLAFTRLLVEASGNFAAEAVFHTVERLVREVPLVAEALYADRAMLHQTVGTIAGALTSTDPAPDVVAQVERAMCAFDEAALTRFRAAVAAHDVEGSGRGTAC